MTAIIAHRGLHVVERENTLGAFRAAVALGVDGIELDVRRTADGTLVVQHDPVVDDLVIGETSFAELPTQLATLDQALDACAGVQVNVEIKNSRHVNEPTYDETGQLARDVVSLIYDKNWSSSVIISCFDVVTCATIRSFDERLPLAWLLDWQLDVPAALTQAHVLGFNAVNPYVGCWNQTTAELAHDLGLDVNVWTVNDRPTMERMVELGVNAIITDDPALGLNVVAHKRPGA